MIKKDQEQKIASLAAYEVIAHRALPDVDSDSWLLRHKKTGARIALLPKDDSNKVFYIAFRTRGSPCFPKTTATRSFISPSARLRRIPPVSRTS